MAPEELIQSIISPREELINLEYLVLAEDDGVPTEEYTQLLEEQTIENYVDGLNDDEVMLQILNHNL